MVHIESLIQSVFHTHPYGLFPIGILWDGDGHFLSVSATSTRLKSAWGSSSSPDFAHWWPN